MTDQPMTKFGPLVQGHCPACQRAALFLGSGGYVTCGNLTCPNPSAADDLLHQRPHDWAAEHCTHSVHTHRTHHHQPVTGCPWCATPADEPHTVDTGEYL